MSKEKSRSVRESSVGFLIHRVQLDMEAKTKKALKKNGYNLHTFALLRALLEFDGATQAKLVDLSSFPDYQVSRTVDTMCELGLVERKEGAESRRTVNIYLTTHGKQQALKMMKLVGTINTEFTDRLKKKETEQLIELLQKLAGSVELGG